MRINRSIPLPIFAIVLSALMIFAIGEYVYLTGNNTKDNFGIRGNLVITIDGKVTINQTDLIMNTAYDYVMCKLFNETTGCSLVGGYIGDSSSATNICQYWTPAGSLSNSGSSGFYSKDLCSLTAIGLSTNSVSPVQGSYGCPSMLTGSGMAPAHASIQHFGSTNQIILTGGWVNSGASQTISYVCLLPYNDKASATVLSVTGSGAADWSPLQDLLSSPQTVGSGQSFGVQWTILF